MLLVSPRAHGRTHTNVHKVQAWTHTCTDTHPHAHTDTKKHAGTCIRAHAKQAEVPSGSPLHPIQDAIVNYTYMLQALCSFNAVVRSKSLNDVSKTKGFHEDVFVNYTYVLQTLCYAMLCYVRF